MTTPTYQVYVDWDGDGGLNIGDFEDSTDGWDSAAAGTTPPTIARSTVRAYHGTGSLLVTWSAGGTIQLVQPDPRTFVVGRSYTMSAWVWVPSSGGMGALCAVAGVALGAASSAVAQWTQITLTFTATSTTHQLQIWSATVPAGGEQTWIDLVRVVGPGEDLLAVPPGVIGDVSMQYGRDQARSLQPVSPGEADFVVDNDDRRFSPEYVPSPLHGLLGPGREVVLEATYGGAVYSLFNGSIDNFDLTSGAGNRVAKFTAIDSLARMKNLPVSTALVPALRTGEAVGKILDAIGWTGGRDLDPGGTTIRWWWAESGDAYQELMEIVAAEGPDAFVHVGARGEFVFRDRHHRLIRAASTSVQAVFKDSGVSGAEVEFDPPCQINYGFRDVINQVEITVNDRAPGAAPVSVWTYTTAFSLPSGATREFEVRASDPFWNVQAPTQGAPSTVMTSDPDIVLSGAVTVTFSRTSGQTTMMTVKATTASTVFSMRLRAYSVQSSSSGSKVSKEDPASITTMRGPKGHKPDTSWMNVEDANAVGDLILSKRSERLPVVTITVLNGVPDQVAQQLSRDLSDRIQVVDSESGLDAACYLERIEHTIRDDGNTHETTFSAEKIPVIPSGLFRFDTSGAGFDQGTFGVSGRDDPATVFRLDTGQGFDQGLLAT